MTDPLQQLLDDAARIQAEQTAPGQLPAETADSVASTEPYIVQYGDSVESLAERFGCDPAELARVNGWIGGGYVIVGAQLVLPE